MKFTGNVWKKLASTLSSGSSGVKPRKPKRAALSWDCLEERTVLSHAGVGFHHDGVIGSAITSLVGRGNTAGSTATTSDSTESNEGGAGDTDGSTSSNSALSTALKTLRTDVQTIELASSTTVAQLTAIKVSLKALATDGLKPSSQSALSSFENSLVTTFASGTTLTGNATLLSQFEAIYTSAPTTQQTTDLTTAYNALASAVTSSNITSANITTINNDWTAVLAARTSATTSTYPYFSLVTGGFGGDGDGGGGGCH